MKSFPRKIFGALSLLLFSTFAAHGQQVADQTVKLRTDLVVLDAQVVNKKTGNAVGGLTPEDFVIFEDGKRQEISHFSRDQLPLSILLLIDTSGSVWEFMDDLRQRALEALNHLKPGDEVAVMGTASRTALIQGFTHERELLAEKISTIEKKALGNDGILLHEAIYQAATYFRKAANPVSRRVIIVVTDNISTQKIGQGHSEKAALIEVYEAGSVVCGLTISNINATVLKFDPFYYAVKGLLFRGDIKAYAQKTGGIVMTGKRQSWDRTLSSMIDQLRTRYTIGYVSSNTATDGNYRKIKLTLTKESEKRHGKLAIITRKGYYAKKSESQNRKE